LNYAEMMHIHTREYRKRYNPKPVVRTDGQMVQPAGSTWFQWSGFVRRKLGDHLTDQEIGSLYLQGYKPADAVRELQRRQEDLS